MSTDHPKRETMSIEEAAVSNMWKMAAIVILALWMTGCSSLRSEEFRAWERQEGKANFLVFVHGFISSKDKAWGSFIPLIKTDEVFNDYDILSYGYPQQLCGQKDDIRDVGAHLKSDLTVELPKYDTTIFVAHSMRGLVVLHALLELESGNFNLVSDKHLRVMSLGTPYYGAKPAGIFGGLCQNPQGEAMQVLEKEGARLVRDWQQRVNKPENEADRKTAQIPVHPFHGMDDALVQQASACGIDPGRCEIIDGNHESIAKPLDREHLTYKQLQSMKGKAGIKTIPTSNSITEPRMPDHRATLLKTCGPSSSTKRPAEEFVPYWVLVVKTLYRTRNEQFRDLENLMQVRGRTPVAEACTDPHSEIIFTLSCLEKMGYLKMENFNPPRVYGRGKDNMKIIFSESRMPIPY
ncbi:MAG: hypothetical protein ABI988_13300 [Nitrospirota bacterium]